MAGEHISKGEIIRLSEITKSFFMGDEEFQALKRISFTLFEGEFTAIMGASGSGKSTCMNIVGCLDKPSSGSYYLDGVDTVGMNSDQLADIRNIKLGFVFQGFNLLSRTSALENVELPMIYQGTHSSERKERAKNALIRVGLGGKESNHPSQLSGGQQQRVAIARALVNNPSLILADEPTGNLDSRTSMEIMQLFTDLNNEGKTIVMVTHEHDIAAFAKRVITFRDGLIISDEKN